MTSVGDEMRRVLPLAGAFSGAVVLGILCVQVDKIVISKMLSVEQFGQYAIASSVALGALQLFGPIVQAAYPRIVQLKDQPAALRSLNLRLIRLIASIAVIAGLAFVFVGEAALRVWLKDETVVGVIYPVLAALLIGTAMNAFYSVGYLNWVAAGRAKRVILVNGISLALSVILVPLLVHQYGLFGGAFAWILTNAVGLGLSLEWVKR